MYTLCHIFKTRQYPNYCGFLRGGGWLPTVFKEQFSMCMNSNRVNVCVVVSDHYWRVGGDCV